MNGFEIPVLANSIERQEVEESITEQAKEFCQVKWIYGGPTQQSAEMQPSEGEDNTGLEFVMAGDWEVKRKSFKYHSMTFYENLGARQVKLGRS